MPINELRALDIFVKAAELGSLRRAAAAQGVTPQAASKALSQLERHLGVRLFHRTTRAMAITDEGRRFLEAAQPALAGLHRAFQTARHAKDEVAGPLRIVGPRSTFVPVLQPVLEEFCRLHPQVRPDVQLDDRLGNWVEDRVDVGFRVGSAAADGVVARRLLPLPLIICAAPSYLAAHGAPERLEELALHRCVAYRRPTGAVMPWHVKVDGDLVDHEVVPAICVDHEELETAVVLSGQAIGLLTGVTAVGPIREGRLVPLLTAHVSDHLALFLYYGNRTSQPARTRAFIDLVVARVVDDPRWLLSAKELAAAEAKGRRAAKPAMRTRSTARR